MTCDLLIPWLLAARSADDLPDEGQAHLRTCTGCRKRMGRLTAVDAAVRRMPPPADPRRREALLDRLDGARPSRAARRLPLSAVWPVAVAASVFLAIGVLLGRWSRSPADEVIEPVAVVAPAPPLLAVVGREAAAASDGNVEAFARIAAALRVDAAARARTGAVDELPRVVAAHDRVLRDGLAPALRRLPEAQRSATAARVEAELVAAAVALTSEIDRNPPAFGDPLGPLLVSLAAAPGHFARANPPPTAPVERPSLLDDLVDRTARVAGTPAPMARAEASAELAATLAQVISVLAVAGHQQDAAAVSESFDRVMSSGVEANLDRAAGEPNRPSDADVKRIRERSATALSVLERNWIVAAPAARAGLEKAISAVKGKLPVGKPPLPPFKGFDKDPKGKGGFPLPPGWPKK